MSVKVMGMVWDLEIEPEQKLVLMAYADHADHNGNNIYPSVALIAKKTGYSERSIQRATHALEEKGCLLPDGKGPHRTNRFRIPISGGIICPIVESGEGDILSPVTICHPDDIPRVTKKHFMGDIAMSPEPSLTIIKPSKNQNHTYSEGDFSKMTVNEAMGIKELRLFRDATDYFPGSPLWWTVYNELHANHWTVEQVKTAYVEWLKRGYNRQSLAWMEWIGEQVPVRAGPHRSPGNRETQNAFVIQEVAAMGKIRK